MKHKLFGLAAAAAVGLTLLTGCPAEEKKETTTTTTTTETSAAPSAAASSETTTTTTTTTESPAAASPAASAATTGAASPEANKMAAAGNVDAKAIFSQKCAPCHGATGGGGMGPNLTNVEAKGDAFIKNRIENGSAAKGMPPFKGQLKAEEIDALVAYVKSL